MTLALSVEEYIEKLAGFENQPLSMEIMLLPFQLSFPSLEEPTLLTGLMIEMLYSEYTSQELVDAYDIASMASELGYDEASRFLRALPLNFVQWIRPAKKRRGASHG